MKRPIEPSEIRTGDLVRWEWDTVAKGGPHAGSKAIEFVAEADHYDRRGSGKYYLLERPEPAVELPTEPTLGFVTNAGRTSVAVAALPSKFSPAAGTERIYARASDPFGWDFMSHVTAFTPATAVPTEALDRIRHEITRDEMDRANGWDAAHRLRRLIDTFLAAVDAANGGAA